MAPITDVSIPTMNLPDSTVWNLLTRDGGESSYSRCADEGGEPDVQRIRAISPRFGILMAKTSAMSFVNICQRELSVPRVFSEPSRI